MSPSCLYSLGAPIDCGGSVTTDSAFTSIPVNPDSRIVTTTAALSAPNLAMRSSTVHVTPTSSSFISTTSLITPESAAATPGLTTSDSASGGVTATPVTSKPALGAGTKVGVTVGVCLGTIIIILLLLILRYRKRVQSTKGQGIQHSSQRQRWTWLPWLQHKGELDAEEQARNELEAEAIRRELAADIPQELPVEERRQELAEKRVSRSLEGGASILANH